MKRCFTFVRDIWEDKSTGHRPLRSLSRCHPLSCTRRSPNVGSMVGQHRRRWASIETALGGRLLCLIDQYLETVATSLLILRFILSDYAVKNILQTFEYIISCWSCLGFEVNFCIHFCISRSLFNMIKTRMRNQIDPNIDKKLVKYDFYWRRKQLFFYDHFQMWTHFGLVSQQLLG